MMYRSEHPGAPAPPWLDFDYADYFTRTWPKLGFSDEDLRLLEQELLRSPKRGPVEPGTGGLRKLRVARPGMGKSGGARIGYAYFPVYGVILVVTVFAKNDQSTLRPEQKRAVEQMLRRYEAHLGTLRQMAPDEISQWRAAIERRQRRARW